MVVSRSLDGLMRYHDLFTISKFMFFNLRPKTNGILCLYQKSHFRCLVVWYTERHLEVGCVSELGLMSRSAFVQLYEFVAMNFL